MSRAANIRIDAGKIEKLLVKGLAVFDFDGTLTARDTFLLFARFVRGREGTYRAIIRSLPVLVAWRLGLKEGGDAKEHLFAQLYRGMSLTVFEAYGDAFAEVVDRNLRHRGMEELRKAQERGDETVICSASVEQWIEPWARRHGIDKVIGTQVEVDENGLLTGRFASPNCKGAGKVARLVREYPDRTDYHVSAYGDSSGDREMLDYADEPYMLRKRLRRDKGVFLSFLIVSVLLVLAIVFSWNRYITNPPSVDFERFPIRGIDVSAHQGMMNLDAVADAGYDFIFIKATEGADYRDPNFALNYMKAGHAGLKRGAYHFFRFDSDGIDQARNLLRVVQARPLELGVVIDVEQHGNPGNVPADTIATRLADMVDLLTLRGYRPMFYSNEQGYEQFVYPNCPGMPLWICSFNESMANGSWTFWQHDHRGKVPGIRGDVDLNVFYGDREQWRQHLRQFAK